jgi:hypothetical protein
MKIRQAVLATLIGLSAISTAAAEDSVTRASAASIGASVLTASAAGWVVYSGSELTVKAVQASGDGVVLILQGASDAVETSARVSAEAAQAASIGAGHSVRVVAESTGYALMAAGTLLAFVPNEIGRALLHDARHNASLR